MSQHFDTMEQVCCLLNLKTVGNITDNCKTLMARDYKGFGAGHEMQTGVIKWKSTNEDEE